MKEFKIKIDIKDCMEVNGNSGNAKIILFSGFCENEYFSGKILEGGADTQLIRHGKRTTVSARYILEGFDYKGTPCRIFIENNGYIDSDGSIHTIPYVLTDSSALKWLETQIKRGYAICHENDFYIVLAT